MNSLFSGQSGSGFPDLGNLPDWKFSSLFVFSFAGLLSLSTLVSLAEHLVVKGGVLWIFN